VKILIPITYLIGPLALCVLLASALVGAALIAGRRRLARLEPSAQSRIALAAAIAPAFLGAVFVGGASYDRLLSGPADFCLHLHDSASPSLILLLSVAILAGRFLTYGIQTIIVILRAVRLSLVLSGASYKPFMGCLVLPVEEPQAYVLGVLKPQVYVSQGLLEQTNEDDLAPVLAHERAHATRRDPLRRLIASAGLVLHRSSAQPAPDAHAGDGRRRRCCPHGRRPGASGRGACPICALAGFNVGMRLSLEKSGRGARPICALARAHPGRRHEVREWRPGGARPGAARSAPAPGALRGRDGRLLGRLVSARPLRRARPSLSSASPAPAPLIR
jgi:hypothetical protein